MTRAALLLALLLTAVPALAQAPRPATPAPAPARSIAIEALDPASGRPVSGALFTVTRPEGGEVVEGASGTVSLAPGRYRVRAVEGARTGETQVEVTARIPEKITVTLAGVLAASLAPERPEAPATSTLAVRWTGPNGRDDYIAFARLPDGLETRRYAYTARGNPARVRVPGVPGAYELRYVSGATGAVLARAPVTSTPVTATLEAPAQGMAGTPVSVTYAGPLSGEDWVGFAKPGAEPNSYVLDAWVYADRKSPQTLVLPAEPGPYELRYVSGLDPRVLATRPVTVTPAAARISAPPQGQAGETVKIAFEGRGAGDSFVGIAKAGAPPRDVVRGASTRARGTEATLRLPAEPGAYEARYVLEANSVYKVLAAAPITVSETKASITAPENAGRRAEFAVTVAGPRGEGDYVSLAAVGAPVAAYEDFRYVRDRATVTLTAPDKVGPYELRYVMQAPGAREPQVIARRAFTVR